MHFHSVLVFAFALFCNALQAAFQPEFINYCEEEGLCNQEVFQVMSDRSGIIWIATDNGVFNYNGKVFNHFGISDGLTDTEVYKIIEDKEGALWMMTGNKKLCYFVNGALYPYPFNDTIQKYLPQGGGLMEINYDSRSGLKLALNYGGFLSIDRKGSPFYFGSSEKNIDTAMCGIYLIQDNTQLLSFQYYSSKACAQTIDSMPLYVCTLSGNNELKTDKVFYFPSSVSSKRKYFSVQRGCVLNNGRLAQIIGDSVYIFQNGKVKRIVVNKSIIAVNYIDNILWIGTRKGVYSYDLATGNLEFKSYLQDYGVSSVAKDLEGGYWFSTLEHGLFYTPSLLLTHHKLKRDQTIVCDFVKKEDQLLISYRNGFIDSYSVKDSTFKNFRQPDTSINIVSYGLVTDKKNRIYSGGTELNCYDQSGKIQKVFSPEFIKKLIHHNGEVFALSKRKLYQIHEDLGITEYPIDFSKIIGFSAVQNELYILCESVSFVFEITPDTLNRRIIKGVKNCRHVWKEDGNLKGITRDGRVLYYINENEFFYSQPILENLVVNNVLVEGKTIWLASNQGVIQTGGENGAEFMQIGQSEGLESDNILKLDKHENLLYYITKNGLGKIPLPINRYLTRPKINRVHFKSSEVIYKNVPKNISLTEQDNEFTIYPNYISFRQPQKLLFHYKLIGANKKISTTTHANISYSGLSSGSYDFFLTSTINNVDFSKPIHFELIIEKPFWKTNWFWAALIFALFGVTISITFQLIKRIKRRELLKREVIELRSKALNAQMNPHFMFNFLNSLQLKIIKKETTEAVNYLGEFCTLIRKNLNYSNENNITLDQEIELSRSYLELEKIRFKNKLDFTFEIAPDVDLTEYMVPPLLLHPFIENSITHGFIQKKDTGIVKIKVESLSLYGLLITITDNGMGFAKQRDSNHKSLGTDLIRQRIKINHSQNSLTLYSVPEKGVRVEIRIYG